MVDSKVVVQAVYKRYDCAQDAQQYTGTYVKAVVQESCPTLANEILPCTNFRSGPHYFSIVFVPLLDGLYTVHSSNDNIPEEVVYPPR